MLLQMNQHQHPHYADVGGSKHHVGMMDAPHDDFGDADAHHLLHGHHQQQHAQQQHHHQTYPGHHHQHQQQQQHQLHNHHALSAASWGGLSHLPHFDGRVDDHDDRDLDDDDGELDEYDGEYGAAVPAPSTSAAASARSASAAGSTSARKAAGSAGAGSGKKEVFVCPEVHCGKTFPRSFALRRHMRIHTGNKPYACDFDGCAQRFNTSGNLSRHKRIHSGERPYPCVFASCGKRFNTSTKLKRHMRIHFPDGQHLFQCVQPTCVFACDNYKEYVHHQRQHGNPAYAAVAPAAAPGAAAGKAQDENVDRSNLPTVATTKVGAPKAAAKQRSRTTKTSKKTAQIAATIAADAVRGIYMGPAASEIPDRRTFGHSPPSSSAVSGLSMLMKEAHRDTDTSAGYVLDHRRPQLKSHAQHPPQHQQHHEDRPPRLPFPTGAFPSETIAASPMNASAAFGSTFLHQQHTGGHSHGHHTNHHNSNRYSMYDHPPSGSNAGTSNSYASSSSSSSFPYMRDGYGSQGAYMAQDGHMHFPPIRPEDSDGYDSSSPSAGMRSSHHQAAEDAKYSYANVPHPVGPEFTGEELSAVLELMKDS